jgi:hypothetical protein
VRDVPLENQTSVVAAQFLLLFGYQHPSVGVDVNQHYGLELLLSPGLQFLHHGLAKSAEAGDHHNVPCCGRLEMLDQRM